MDTTIWIAIVFGILGLLWFLTRRNKSPTNTSEIKVNTNKWVINMTVPDIVRKMAKSKPKVKGLMSGISDKHWTYKELQERIDEISGQLLEWGTKEGDVIGICLPYGLDCYFATFAAMNSGSVAAMLNPLYTPNEIDHCLKQSSCKILICEGRRVNEFLEKLESAPTLKLIISVSPPKEILNPNGYPIKFHEFSYEPNNTVKPFYSKTVKLDDSAAIIFTSGTTGLPKPALLSHKSISYYKMTWMDYLLLLCDNFTTLTMAPLYHPKVTCYEMGIPLVLQGVTDFDPDEAVNTINKHVVRVISSSPSITLPLLHSLKKTSKGPLWVISLAGSSVPQELYDLAKEIKIDIQNRYGMTEIGLGISVSNGVVEGEGEMRIVDEQGRVVSQGQVGQLQVRTTTLIKGYIGHTDKITDDSGWFSTGDLATMRKGKVEIVGRSKDVIVRGGANVYPQEIENALNAHPYVKESSVVGVPNPGLGEAVVAFVLKRPEANTVSEEELRSFCTTRLTSYKIPMRIWTIDSFPRTGLGKVKKFELKKQAEELLKSDTNRPIASYTPEERKVVEIMSKVLKIPADSIHPQDSFYTIGGNSLSAIQLARALSSELKIKLTPADIHRSPTPFQLALKFNSPTSEGIDWAKESYLEPTIIPSTNIIIHNGPSNVFLTGATGFLGNHLLQDLLKDTNKWSSIYCLVRANNEDEGRSRLVSTCAAHEFDLKPYLDRVHVIIGHLDKPLFGLSEQLFKELSEKVHVIIHCGAVVHWMQPYESLAKSNVLGTKEALKLACQSHPKPFHFISTFAVLNSGSMNWKSYLTFSMKENLDAGPQPPTDPYPQSKWVAEKLCVAASQRGLPVYIHRPSYISGHTKTGVTNEDDFLSRLWKGSIQLGSFPSIHDKQIFIIAPVDWVSQTVINIAASNIHKGKAFHLITENNLKCSVFFRALKEFGYTLNEIPYKEWLSKLEVACQKSSDDNETNALQPVSSLFNSRSDVFATATESGFQFSIQNSVVAAGPILKQNIQNDQLCLSLSHLVATGFLPKPQTNWERWSREVGPRLPLRRSHA